MTKADDERMARLTREFEFGASPNYKGEPFRRVVFIEPESDVQEAEDEDDEMTVLNIGELSHTPVRTDPAELREAPVDEIVVIEVVNDDT